VAGNVRELRNVLERAAIVSDRDLIGRGISPRISGMPRDGGLDLTSLRFPLSTTWSC